jgi:hypothetical protein
MAGNTRQQFGTGFLPGQTKLWRVPRQSFAWAVILMFTRDRLIPLLTIVSFRPESETLVVEISRNITHQLQDKNSLSRAHLCERRNYTPQSLKFSQGLKAQSF